ncbi:fibronectin type III domain-containing protein [Saccharothrix syringae]|uniref:Fibronectin type III domain-containing protein n=1 Tax=Saccharothrix syringae TaxID=103733 RepID=A0A5Q0GZ05_SACSY|nr:fibronectin type III domain-containing protein [Saccharothrix syringae]QFZ19083.1 fibronectin type III domain-containing protein [Saccharothrix syringae]
MRGTPRRVAVGLLALALLGVTAPGGASAAPAELGLDYTCATSLGPRVPVRVQVRAGLPDEVSGQPNTVAYYEPAYVDVDLAFGGAAALGAAAVRIDGDSTATLGATFTGPGGTQAAEAALTFAPTKVTGGAVPRAAGGFPALYFHQAGQYAVHLGDLALSLRPERADGTPLGVVTATCSHDPAADDRLATLTSHSIIIERPVRPTQLRVTATTPTSASFSWYSSPWWFETAGYEIYLDDVKVAFVTEKQATLTGLAPDSQHRVKVVTRDVGGFSSTKSQGLVFATPPAR